MEGTGPGSKSFVSSLFGLSCKKRGAGVSQTGDFCSFFYFSAVGKRRHAGRRRGEERKRGKRGCEGSEVASLEHPSFSSGVTSDFGWGVCRSDVLWLSCFFSIYRGPLFSARVFLHFPYFGCAFFSVLCCLHFSFLRPFRLNCLAYFVARTK